VPAELNLAIRRTTDNEAVGWVEFRRAGEEAEVSYNVAAELRGQGIAPRALSAFLAWAGLGRASSLPNICLPRCRSSLGYGLMSTALEFWIWPLFRLRPVLSQPGDG
jgi:Acetyltransferase (GNAT) domain